MSWNFGGGGGGGGGSGGGGPGGSVEQAFMTLGIERQDLAKRASPEDDSLVQNTIEDLERLKRPRREEVTSSAPPGQILLGSSEESLYVT